MPRPAATTSGRAGGGTSRRSRAAFGTTGHARLLIAEREGVPLSAVLLVMFGDTVSYKIGGWTDVEGAPPGANELTHWTGIEWAHRAGYRYYDVEGLTLEVAQALRDGRPAAHRGVAFFKLGFGATPWPTRAPRPPPGRAPRPRTRVRPASRETVAGRRAPACRTPRLIDDAGARRPETTKRALPVGRTRCRSWCAARDSNPEPAG